MNRKTVNFIVAANNAGSITRLVTAYANSLISKGFNVIISYPVVNHWDFHVWQLDREYPRKNNPTKIFQYYFDLIKPILKRVARILVRRKSIKWCAKMYKIDKRIILNRYFLLPSNRNMPEADFMMVMGQEYLIPRLLRLKGSKGKIVAGIHLDYMAATADPAMGKWWDRVVSINKEISVPRFASSNRAKLNARRLGIDVADTVIHNGVNINEFTDGRRRGKLTPLNITLYCDPRPQKGTEFGYLVVDRLRRELKDGAIIFRRLGNVTQELDKNEKFKKLFDINLGYLTGGNYIKAYQETDILIYPSLYEGFSLAIVHAMACGCALVATRVSGLEEFGLHRESCMISEPKDIEAMVENVKILINEHVLRDKIRENALRTVKRYSWDKSAEKLIDFLEENIS